MRLRELAIIAGIAISASTATSSRSWWLDAKFIPDDEQVLGLSVQSLSADWTKAKVLTARDIPVGAKPGLVEIKEAGYRFSIESDLDADGVSEKTVVGVFENATGERGSFFAVVASSKSVKPRLLLLGRLTGMPQFSILFERPTAIVWGRCMWCDDVGEIRFRDGEWAFSWLNNDYGALTPHNSYQAQVVNSTD